MVRPSEDGHAKLVDPLSPDPAVANSPQFEDPADIQDSFMDEHTSLLKRTLDEAFSENDDSSEDTSRYSRQIFSLNQESVSKDETPFDKLAEELQTSNTKSGQLEGPESLGDEGSKGPHL